MNVSASIFRENDIRGIYPEQINESTIKLIAYAIARKCKKHGISSIVVGRDGRLSGPSLLESFCDGLLEANIDVNNIGLVTSPLLYFAAKKETSKSGIMITGSHNPKNHNGIKMVINDKPVSGTEIFELLGGLEENSQKGCIKYTDIKQLYLEEVSKNISVSNPGEFKVVLDCGNGAAGCIAPELFKKIGFSVTELYSEVDGNFPNHHPDPGKLDNLKDLIAEVNKKNADLGLAFDGDGDRVGLVTNKGEVVFPDKLMMLFSKDILSREKGKIVFDVKLSAVEEMGKKLNVGSVYLYQNGKLIDSVVTQTGKCLFNLDTGYVYKIEFSKHDYVSKYLIVETTKVPKDIKRNSRIKVDVGLFKNRRELNMHFLSNKPIGIASYSYTEKKIAWNYAYTDKIIEEIVDATIVFTREKEKGKRDNF